MIREGKDREGYNVCLAEASIILYERTFWISYSLVSKCLVLLFKNDKRELSLPVTPLKLHVTRSAVWALDSHKSLN